MATMSLTKRLRIGVDVGGTNTLSPSSLIHTPTKALR